MTTSSQTEYGNEFVTTNSRGWQRFFNAKNWMYVSILFGIVVSGYLTYVKFTAEPMVCIANGPFDCNVVQNSLYSQFLGIPVAYYGLASYLLLGGLLLFEDRIGILRQEGRLIVFAIALFGWIYSMWLVYVQVAILEALCPWCLAHEANFTVFFGLAIYRLMKDMRQA